METPPPSSDSKPKAIIIGNVNISPMHPQELTQYTLPSIEPTLNRLDRNQRPRRERDSTVFNSHVVRLRLAILVFVASMFFEWRLDFWNFFTYGYAQEIFEESDTTLATFIGLQAVILFILRDLPIVLLPISFVYCLAKKEHSAQFYEKLSLSIVVYFCLITLGLIHTRLNFGDAQIDVYLNVAEEKGSIFAAPGYWLAGLSSVLIHPKWIPISENLMLWKKPAPDNEDSALHGLVRTRTDSTAKTSTSPDIFVMFLYYLPPLYLCMVALDVSNGGNDNAFFMGIMAPIIGFLVGLFHLRWEFFNGFLLQLGFSFPVAFLLCVAGAVGLFGDISDFGEALLITLLAALILPFKYHRNSSHGRALGAIYGATLGVCLMLFGLILGVISRYGFF